MTGRENKQNRVGIFIVLGEEGGSDFENCHGKPAYCVYGGYTGKHEHGPSISPELPPRSFVIFVGFRFFAESRKTETGEIGGFSETC